MTSYGATLAEGRKQGTALTLRQILLDLLRTKFGRIPRGTEKAIQATEDIALLRSWVKRSGTAASLEDMELAPRN